MTAFPIDHSHRRAEPEERRTFNKTLRYSRTVEHGRKERYPQLSKKEQWLRLFGLKLYRPKLREAGQRWGTAGTISAGAVDLYELILKLEARFGLVDPSAAWFAEQLNVPEKVIHAWKTQLQAHGFLFWERRCVQTGNDGRRGPQLQQTSNRYWTALPRRALELVSVIRRKIGLKPDPREVTEAEKAVMRPAARRRSDDLDRMHREAKKALSGRLEALGQAVAQEEADNGRWRQGRTRIPPS